MAEAKHYQQYWFEPGQRAKAAKIIRNLIGKVQETLLIADPYFGALQVPQFLYAVQMSQVKITVLTSRLAFEADEESNDNEQTHQAITQKLAMLDRSVTQLQELGNPNCKVMVMPGKTPKLHDRFMLIDNNVWLIGSSLNALGNRASMMMKLPNPKPVKDSLEDMLSSAKPYKVQYRKYYPENKHKGNGDADQT